MGGGRGNRLYPLTRYRCKPAVPLGGSYRLIDIPVSNCINSKLNKIFILSQYNSASLNKHIAQSYQFDIFRGGFVEILAAEQTASRSEWFQGTADAVRRNLHHFASSCDYEYCLILAGDHLYRMDYQKFLQFHIQKDASISIGVYPVSENQVEGFGILKVNPHDQIVDFVEKPKDPRIIRQFKVPGKGRTKTTQLDKSRECRDYLASMGIYIFSREVLLECLRDEKMTDFGRDIIPASLRKYRVMAYPFTGYWEDIGTIGAFYNANLSMAEPDAPFQFITDEGPIYTHARYLTGSQVEECSLKHVLLANGCVIRKSTIERSVIGIRSIIGQDCSLSEVVMMGADFTENSSQIRNARKKGLPPVGIGAGSVIKGAIIDKNARIGRGVVIENREKHSTLDAEGYAIRDGIVVVEKNAVIPDGTVI